MCYTHPQMTAANNCELLFAQENQQGSWSRFVERQSSHDGTCLIVNCFFHGTRVFPREVARKARVLTNSLHSVSQGMWEGSLATVIMCPSLEADVVPEHIRFFCTSNACLFRGHLWVNQSVCFVQYSLTYTLPDFAREMTRIFG